IRWAAAGHPGATLVGPVAFDVPFASGSIERPRPQTRTLGGGGAGLGTSLVVATRGDAVFSPDTLLVVVSSAVRGGDEAHWHQAVSEQAPAGSRLASVLVDAALRSGDPAEDLLAVVVRQRADRRSAPVIARPAS
ncbi:MAG: hypothetical protein M3680_29390, partial [Myxococcota bacterium]|nr:hypothetical protein [Myxococcota bacterium]